MTLVAARPASGSGADRTLTVSRRLLRGTKPLRAPCLDKERPTRGLGTPLDDPARGDLEEMPVDHGNEGLKLAARVIRAPRSTNWGRIPLRWVFRTSRRMCRAYVRQSSELCSGDGQQMWTRG